MIWILDATQFPKCPLPHFLFIPPLSGIHAY